MNIVKMERDSRLELINLINWLDSKPKNVDLGNRLNENVCELIEDYMYDILNENPDRYSYCTPSYIDGQLYVEKWDDETGESENCLVQPVDL